MSMEEIKIDMAYGVIESCSGFDDDTTSVGEAWHVVKEYINGLKHDLERANNALEDCAELPTIAAMWAHHNRDDEVRELRAMCENWQTSMNRMSAQNDELWTICSALATFIRNQNCEACSLAGPACPECTVGQTLAEYYSWKPTNKSEVDSD